MSHLRGAGAISGGPREESASFFRAKTYLNELARPLSLLAHLFGAPKTGLPKTLVNGLPKAGTHLLEHCVSRLPLRRRHLLTPLQATPEWVEPPTPAYLAKLDWMLSRMKPGEYILVHLYHHPSIEALLRERGVLMVSIMRDPRDVAAARVLSRTAERIDRARHGGASRSRDERLADCIRIGTAHPYPNLTMDIGRKTRAFLPWEGSPLNLPVRYEALIGARGGGNAAEQEKTVAGIARHLGLDLPDERLRAAAAGTFWDRSYSFRRGRIGDWKELFTPEHKAAFKEVAGTLLIEMGYEKDDAW